MDTPFDLLTGRQGHHTKLIKSSLDLGGNVPQSLQPPETCGWDLTSQPAPEGGNYVLLGHTGTSSARGLAADPEQAPPALTADQVSDNYSGSSC